jgi:hypothetical protein
MVPLKRGLAGTLKRRCSQIIASIAQMHVSIVGKQALPASLSYIAMSDNKSARKPFCIFPESFRPFKPPAHPLNEGSRGIQHLVPVVALGKQIVCPPFSFRSLDQVSNGRFLFGIGCGWNAEEIWKTMAPCTKRAC